MTNRYFLVMQAGLLTLVSILLCFSLESRRELKQQVATLQTALAVEQAVNASGCIPKELE